MKIPAFRRIIVEDYDAKYRDMVSKLAYSINSFADTTNTALTGNLSINDNTSSVQTTINVTVGPSGTPTSGATIATNLTSQCSGIAVIRAVNNTNASDYPTSQPFISFSNAVNGSNNTIIISNVSGLKANNSYSLTIILYPSA